MRNSRGFHGLVLAGLVFTATSGLAQVPALVNYQGRVAVDGTNFNGTGQFQFALVDGGTDLSQPATAISHRTGLFVTSVEIVDGGAGYLVAPAVSFTGGGGSGAEAHAQIGGGAVTNIVVDATGGGYTSDPNVVLEAPPIDMSYETYWSNGAPVEVAVVKGLYSVVLGETDLPNMAALPPGVFTNSDVRLRVSFDDGVNGLQQLTPDSRLTAAGYSLMAEAIRAGAVGEAQLADGAVDTLQLAADAVTSDKILDGEVVLGTDTAGTYDSTPDTIADDNTIDSAEITDNSVASADILDGSVSNVDLAADAVTSAKILDGAVTNADLANGAVTGDKIAINAVSGGKVADGTLLAADVNAATFSNTFWKADGNAGTSPGTHFLGTTDNEALELQVDAQRALRIEPDADSPRWAAGYSGNVASAAGAVVAGGGASGSGFLGFGPNQALANFAAIGGGSSNAVQLNADHGVIAGGARNTIQSGAWYGFIGGGTSNGIQENAEYGAIGGGEGNRIQTNTDYSVIGGGSSNMIRTNANCSLVGGGIRNTIENNASNSVIAGGWSNAVQVGASVGAIGGGYRNTIQTNATRCTIGGGYQNTIQTNATGGTICGGLQNVIQAISAYATIAGGYMNEIQTNANFSAIGGGYNNQIQYSVPSGTIAGGYENILETNADYSVIGGGNGNQIGIGSTYGVIGGGNDNEVGLGAYAAVIGGGYLNILGTNTDACIIPGGYACTISNNVQYTFAAGRRAKVGHSGTFVWADSQNSNFGSTTSNEVSFRCQNGVRFNSGTAAANQQVAWVPGDASWTFTSDREKKEGFEAVDAAAVLEKVAALPLSWWVYKGYDVRHIGPMAQDFHAAFDLGRDEKGLDGADLDGVALAAIQGLYRENQDLKARVTELERKVELLMERLPQ